MNKQPKLYDDEMTRFLARLNRRSWVQWIQCLSPDHLIVHTTDEQAWTVNSGLSYARLLYCYEYKDEDAS